MAYHDGMAKLLKKVSIYHDDWWREETLREAEGHLASAREAEKNAWIIQTNYRPLGRAKEKVELAEHHACLGHSMIKNGRFVAIPHYWEEYEFLTIRKDRPPWSWFTTRAKIPWLMLLSAENSWQKREDDFRTASEEINKLWESQEVEANAKK